MPGARRWGTTAAGLPAAPIATGSRRRRPDRNASRLLYQADSDRKARWRPFGDQRCIESVRGPAVIWVGGPPAVLTVQMVDLGHLLSNLKESPTAKATRVPSARSAHLRRS